MVQRKKIMPHAPAPLEAILESISDGVFTVDGDWRITSFNRAAETITGVPRREALGRPCCEVFRANMCEASCALRQTLSNNTPVIDRPAYFVRADGERVPISVSTAVLRDSTGKVIGGAETFRDLSDVEALRRELSGRWQVGDLVSHSAAMRRIMELLPAVAASASTVLIQGETGTGKEILARTIHGQSPRCKKPFIAVNCGALPDNLLESELFGHRKGAFTGADRDHPGRFAAAEGGTLFLDEIGEISPAMQVRLLRVLQERTYEPLGDNHPVRTNVRIIAAGNQDLAQLVEKGSFRQDLYYRINVVRLDLPPLRERREDIPLLIEHFVERFRRLQGKPIQGLSRQALALLLAHHWPGNIRELENVLERAFVLATGDRIESSDLPDEIAGTGSPRQRQGDMRGVRQQIEAQAILDALRRNDGNRLAAARELGIHKSTLFRKILSLGLDLKNL